MCLDVKTTERRVCVVLTETLEHGLLLASGVVSTVVAGTGAYYAGKKNKRDDSAEDRAAVSELIKLKDEMIEALKEDRESLKQQLDDSLRREADLAKKVADLERRQRDGEREWNRALTRVLEAIASSDQCLNAPACINRRPPSASFPTGTD